MDLLDWLREEDLPEPRPAAELAEEARKAASRFRMAFGAEEAARAIRQTADQYAILETACKRLALRVFLDPSDQSSRQAHDLYIDFRRQFLTEYSDYFLMVTQSSKGEKAKAYLGQSYWDALKRLSASARKELAPELEAERAEVRSQEERLDRLSFSSTRPAAVRGDTRRLLQSMSRDRRMRAYHTLAGDLARSLKETEQSFARLHELRRNLAEKAGYLSFYDYTVSRSGLDDQARPQIPVFRKLVEEHIAPLLPKARSLQWERTGQSEPRPWDLLYPAVFGVPVLDTQAFPLEDTYLEALTAIFTAKSPLYEAMKEKGALSFRVMPGPGADEVPAELCSMDGGSGVLGAYMPGIGKSFLFLSQVPQERLGRILFSETGLLLLNQANAAQEEPFPFAAPEAILQTVRHSMAFLSQKTWGLFYGNMARYAREYDLLELLADLPLYAALDEMEEFLCRARVTNLNVFRHAWGEIASRYQLDGAAAGSPGLLPPEDLWLYAPSWWTRPLEGIYYALGAVSVLGTLPLGRHYRRLEDAFVRLLVAPPEMPACQRIAKAGYPSPFEEETVRKAAFAMADFLGL